MMKILKYMVIINLMLLPSAAFAWQWLDLWRTHDQQGATLLQKGKAKDAAQAFHNKDWQAVSYYRAGDYEQAFKKFSSNKTSDDQYNAGNAAAYQGHYDAAIAAYDKAIAINPNNNDALTNRDIVKKIKEQKQQEQNKSADNKKDKNDQKDAKNSADKNSDSDKDKEAAKNNQQQDAQNKAGQNDASKQADNSSPDQKNQPASADSEQQKQADNAANQNPHNQPGDAEPLNSSTLSASGVQTKDEANKQMLRRLADDPGGLLRQKFMRDYLRRHSSDANPGQGDDNGVQ